MKYIAPLFSLLVALILLVPTYTAKAAPALDNRACTPDRGLDVVIVFDNGPDIYGNQNAFQYRFDAAKQFIDTLQDYDRTSIVKFNSGAEILQPLTSEKDLSKSAMDRIQLEPNTDSSLRSGIQAGLDEFKKSSRNNHKVMIVLTNGNSPDNAASLELANQAALEEVQINIIGLGALFTPQPDDPGLIKDWDSLQKIAEATEGKAIQHNASLTADLVKVFDSIMQGNEDQREPKVYGTPWVLTRDLTVNGDLILAEDMVMDLNGYDLTITNGDLVMLACSELRAVSGVIGVEQNVKQEAGSYIRLNNSQLKVEDTFTQQGYLRVNGDFANAPEIVAGSFDQQRLGSLDLNGYDMSVGSPASIQKGNVSLGGGTMSVAGDFTQQGWFDVAGGELLIDGDLTINGGLLIDDAFRENKSLNVNGGYVRVGTASGGAQNGNVIQESGQLYVNYGIVDIFSDYTIKNGWLTMIHSTMDTTSNVDFIDDGDYVHVRGDFTMQSPRSHAARSYSQLGMPMSDQGHLTNGILRVDGNFKQVGDKEYHTSYSDRSQQFRQDYSRYNFAAAGKHKVWLTGAGKTIQMNSQAATFSILQLEGGLEDYNVGGVRWKQLMESAASGDATLASLSINDVPVLNFSPNVTNYIHTVPAETIEDGQLPLLKVDARATDHRNATVQVTGNAIRSDGTAEVKVLVTAGDGTERVYTIAVSVGGEVPGKVTGITADQKEVVFTYENGVSNPLAAIVSYTITPNNAINQGAGCESLDENVAKAQIQTGNCRIEAKGPGVTTVRIYSLEGGHSTYVNVRVIEGTKLLDGIKTLADLVSDTKRYNEIVALYDLNDIGVSVPGKFIDTVQLSSVDRFVTGTINTLGNDIARVEVKVNGQQLAATEISPNTFIFNRAGLSFNDYIEVVAYDSSNNEKERVGRSYHPGIDQLYARNTAVNSGAISLRQLIASPSTFSNILDNYSLDELVFLAEMPN